jgi:hypothetical protein
MSNKKYQLLCTFAPKETLISTAKTISTSFELPYKKIYIYENDKNKSELIFTYNISGEYSSDQFLRCTILVHRNKDTNTLYTINALNFLICEINNGILDRKFPIPWENYNNLLLLNNKDELRKINLKLKDIVCWGKDNSLISNN